MKFQREFDLDAQLAFGRLSGDVNPIHVDPLFARRSKMGLAVHGVHALLWALDVICASHAFPTSIARIGAVFRQPIRVGDLVIAEARLGSQQDRRLAIELAVAGQRCTKISVERCDEPPSMTNVPEGDVPVGIAADLSFEQAAAGKGSVALLLDKRSANALFPNILNCIAPNQLAFLLSTTRIVGMECPGLHSMLAEIDVSLSANADLADEGSKTTTFHVTSADARFSLLQIAMAGGGALAAVKAILRPKPFDQPPIDTVARYVQATSFSGRKALIVGGSRGLGELAAKAIVTGGGSVCVTFSKSAERAKALVEHLRTRDSSAFAIHLDVESDMSGLRGNLGTWRPDCVLYFASPRIDFSDAHFNEPLFQRYLRYYVAGLSHLVRALAPSKSEPLLLIYPSTTFLDSPPFGAREYISAKAAGEGLCKYLNAHARGVTAHAVRLPRLLTDQTSGADGLPSTEEHLRQFLECLSPLLKRA